MDSLRADAKFALYCIRTRDKFGFMHWLAFCQPTFRCSVCGLGICDGCGWTTDETPRCDRCFSSRFQEARRGA